MTTEELDDLANGLNSFNELLNESKFTQDIIGEMVTVDKSDWAF
jgi:hypothetical protein